MAPVPVTPEQRLLLANCGVKFPANYGLFCELPFFGKVYAEARNWGLISSFFRPTQQSPTDGHFRLVKGDDYTGVIVYGADKKLYQFFASLSLDRSSRPSFSAGETSKRLTDAELVDRCGLPWGTYDLAAESNMILEDVLRVALPRLGLQPGPFVRSREPNPAGKSLLSMTDAHFRLFERGTYRAVITSEGSIPTYRLYVPR